MTETVEITLYLLNKYENFAYIPSNFNKNEIEQIRALDYLTHVYVTTKGKELFIKELFTPEEQTKAILSIL